MRDKMRDQQTYNYNTIEICSTNIHLKTNKEIYKETELANLFQIMFLILPGVSTTLQLYLT